MNAPVRPNWAMNFGTDDSGRYWLRTEVARVVFEMRFCEPGRFVMGSPASEVQRWKDEEPAQEIELTRGFWMGTMPVTQELWKEVTGSRRSRFPINVNEEQEVEWKTYPVDNATEEDCREFFEKLRACHKGELRMPTEAEWEYACRAGTTTRFSFGEALDQDDKALSDFAWYRENSDGKPHRVGAKLPNSWGFYDFHGNVFERTKRVGETKGYHSLGSGGTVVDPIGHDTETALRGGCWNNIARALRSACRYWLTTGPDGYGKMGLRLAASDVNAQ